MTVTRKAITRMHLFWMVVVGLLAFVFVWFVVPRVAGAEEAEEPSYWMQKKMQYSENILAGLAKADFAAIEKNAASMNSLSQIEGWVRGNTPEYKRQLKAFRAANRNLVRLSQEKDLEGAALSFMQLTMTCVQCHQVIRDTTE
jgi:hypothetical protein